MIGRFTDGSILYGIGGGRRVDGLEGFSRDGSLRRMRSRETASMLHLWWLMRQLWTRVQSVTVVELGVFTLHELRLFFFVWFGYSSHPKPAIVEGRCAERALLGCVLSCCLAVLCV